MKRNYTGGTYSYHFLNLADRFQATAGPVQPPPANVARPPKLPQSAVAHLPATQPRLAVALPSVPAQPRLAGARLPAPRLYQTLGSDHRAAAAQAYHPDRP